MALAGALCLSAGCSLPRGAIYPAPPRAPVPRIESAVLVDETTADGTPVVALYVPPPEGGRVVVFFHGNGMQLSDSAFLADLLRRRGVGVLAVEFPGYGPASGVPSESSIYASAEGALVWLREHHGIGSSRVVLAGYSLGSGPAVEMALRKHGRSLVLLAPLPSIPAMGRHYLPILPDSFFPDRYDNLEKASHLHIPVLLVHGARDELIPPDTTLRLAELLPCSVTMWGLSADHRLFRGRAAELCDWIAAFATLDDDCKK